MQNKGAIKLFAILLAAVSLYQLSFTWFANRVKRDAAEFAQGDPKAERAYLDSMATVEVYPLLNFTFRECQEQELNLGLDLKGGMNVTLEVSVVDIIKVMAGTMSNDTLFQRTLAKAKELQRSSQEDFVTLFGKAFEEIAPQGASLAQFFYGNPDLKDKKVDYNTPNADIIKLLAEETEGAIANSFNILDSRINRFGVSQPNIQRLETSGRILVELPGIKEPDRVRKLLQGTANLEFWETYDNVEIVESLTAANTKLAELYSTGENSETDSLLSTEQVIESDSLKINEENTEIAGEEAVVENSEVITETTTSDIASEEKSLLDEIEKDSLAAQNESAEEWRSKNPLFSRLQARFDSQQGRWLNGASIGIVAVKDTGKVMEYLNMPQIRELFPRDIVFSWTNKAPAWDATGVTRELIALKKSIHSKYPSGAALGGECITNARDEIDQNAYYKVTMSMDGEGAKTWARITKEAASQNPKRQVAVVLDDYVYTYPTVQNEIKGGSSEITGNFTAAESADLANILKSGAMPAPARILEEEIVGPSLGQEAINSGLISFVIAFVLVLIFMVFYYNAAGIVADIALLANIFFIFGVLASLQAVLTLPGIAGIVLTIGMSVDANVLIFERIREELRLGKGKKLAISDGYKNALSAIIDANVTTILTAIILFIFGHGPIKGFATTLIIGICTSLFSAIFITRLIFIALIDRKKDIKFAIKMTENIMQNVNIQFVQIRKKYYYISGAVILIGIISMLTQGLNQGIDFSGGRTYVVRFDQNVSTVDIASSLKDVFNDAPEVKTFGGSNQVRITTKYMIDSEDPDVDAIIESKLFTGLQQFFNNSITEEQFKQEFDGKVVGKMSSQKVGPTVADDIKIASVWAVLAALLGMFIYIFIRFKNWRFGFGAIVALAHDVLIVLGLFSLLYKILPFSLEINQAFIAAILTVVGYSVNDTVIVFDRIREFVTLHPKREIGETYNSALNSTLSRTINTSFTTILVLIAIFIFGGEVIRGFVFAILIGIVVGTYSSLFVATPVVYDTMKRLEKIKEKIQEKKNKK